MKKSPLSTALAAALIGATGIAAAHSSRIDVGPAGTPTVRGINAARPTRTVWVPAVTTDGASRTITLNASAANPLPAGFKGEPLCPYGGVLQDAAGNPVLNAAGAVQPCVYTQVGPTNFTAGGWIEGTEKYLGDSHRTHGGQFFTFTLTAKSKVTITVSREPGYVPKDGLADEFDPSFSLYEHLLPLASHDDTLFDPEQPTSDAGYYIASQTDRSPLDPGVAKYNFNADSGEITRNPAWNPVLATFYKVLYPANGPYRDTQNYTATGGLDSNGVAKSPVDGQSPYRGQFNATGNWSMANDTAQLIATPDILYSGDPRVVEQTSLNLSSGRKPVKDGTRAVIDPATGLSVWSELRFIAARNKQAGAEAEKLTVELAPGDYTLAIGDAGAASGRAFGGRISVKYTPAN